MKRILGLCAMAVMALTVFVASSCAQEKGPRPSPPAKAECKVADGKTITIDYSSPRMKGRKIFGELVPYGKVWRAGANEATTFVTTGDTSVGGTTVPAGSYTIFVIPTADKWTLVISKKTGEWGTAYPGEATTWRALIWRYQRRLRHWRTSRLTSIRSAADARCK